MRTILTVLAGIKKSPGKTLMTLFAVGLGVGVLISSINISSAFSSFIQSELTESGVIINVANAEYSNEGRLERIRPSEFDNRVMEILKAELPGAPYISPATLPFYDLRVRAEGNTYRIRSILGVNEEYLDIMGLDTIAGQPFAAEDIENGEKEAIISEDLAKTLFGSIENALGKTIRPPGAESSGPITTAAAASRNEADTSGSSGSGGSGDGGARRRFVLPAYTITGVFETPSELKRKSFGIGDVLVPYLALLPSGMNQEMARGFLLSTLTLRVSGISAVSAASTAREILSREYGDDITVHVWEGTPHGDSGILKEARRSLSTTTVVINLLGFILLITGSIGILSIMIVETAGRSREIAMKQALGACKGIIIKEFWLRSVILSLLSAGVGVALSVILLEPLRSIIIPIFSDITMNELSSTLFHPVSVAVGTGAAILFGGMFGIFPVFTALKTPISEGIREV